MKRTASLLRAALRIRRAAAEPTIVEVAGGVARACVCCAEDPDGRRLVDRLSGPCAKTVAQIIAGVEGSSEWASRTIVETEKRAERVS